MSTVRNIRAFDSRFIAEKERTGKRRLGKAILFFLVIMQSTFISCARGQTVYAHSFGFDTIFDSPHPEHPEVEVLDYQYGANGQFWTRADKDQVEHGKTFTRWQTSGPMSRGEFLYVKWRIKSSQEVHQDKVDLRGRLPKDVTDYGIHFIASGPQLYVYLIPPPGIWSALSARKSPDYLVQHQIYPNPSK